MGLVTSSSRLRRAGSLECRHDFFGQQADVPYYHVVRDHAAGVDLRDDAVQPQLLAQLQVSNCMNMPQCMDQPLGKRLVCRKKRRDGWASKAQGKLGVKLTRDRRAGGFPGHFERCRTGRFAAHSFTSVPGLWYDYVRQYTPGGSGSVVERLLAKEKVAGSNPVFRSTLTNQDGSAWSRLFVAATRRAAGQPKKPCPPFT